MPETSFLQRHFKLSLSQFVQLPTDKRAATARAAIPDLNFFFSEGRPIAERPEPELTRTMAQSLLAHLQAPGQHDEHHVRTLSERVVTDGFLRSECDRDQNVYLGPLFTRTLTRAVPDVIFQPSSTPEVVSALRWAGEHRVPVTLRGAASTAMGGAVPADAGLVLDLSRLDLIDIDAAGKVVVVGAGTRLRTLHQKLREKGLALPVYPSNLGGTYAGWFVTGGIGMNAYGRGRAHEPVRAADLVLARGEHVRFHSDGRLDVPDGKHRRTLPAAESEGWFRAHGYPALALADLAGSEGQFGVLTQLTLALEPLPTIAAFLLGFSSEKDALAAVDWLERQVQAGFTPPANVKLLSGSHMHHVERVWDEEDRRPWHERPSAFADDRSFPWARVISPAQPGANGTRHGAAYLFVDFLSEDAGCAFAALLSSCPGTPQLSPEASARFARERFRPQQVKRLGPGLLAAEIVLPSRHVAAFLPQAERLAKNAGAELDAEVYYLADGTALAIAGYLTDHRKGSFAIDLALAPALLDLAMSRFEGRPYVLGRWQAAYFGKRFGAQQASRLRALKRAIDPARLLNRGAFFSMGLRGPMGAALATTFVPAIRTLRVTLGLAPALVGAVRAALASMHGPAWGRGVSALERPLPAPGAPPGEDATGRALTCVNCGECNSVCPIFNESRIRLPQMLTHLGEALHAGETIGETGSTLLDLCMRCGNCEEVCQAGIPHLPLYQVMQNASDRTRPYDRERHVALLESLRSSARYAQQFLGVRTGGYLKRTPASLPGGTRFVLLRAENEAGPAATCIHCAACVDVCPTSANKEYEGTDPRYITTDQARCIGCGTCVEVCPANHINGGQTLRVMEAPTLEWFTVVKEFAGRDPS